MINVTPVKLAPKPMFFELDINDAPPPLALLINPTDFNMSFTKKATPSRGRPSSRNRAAFSIQFAHDELDVLSCSGTSAQFYGKKGLTRENAHQSLGYRNFRSLVEIYRNNGSNYNLRQKDSFVTGGDGLIESVGRVIIVYDDVIYRGSFDNLSVIESDANPFNLQFNFQFTVSEKIDVRND